MKIIKNKNDDVILSVHEEEYPEEVSKFLTYLSSAKLPPRKEKGDVWKHISTKIEHAHTNTKHTNTKQIMLPYWKPLVIAASISIILLVFIIPMFNSPINQVHFATDLGEFKKVTLPDESVVMLNANSTISYKKPWNRELYLSGEAFFKVSEKGKFVVNNDIGKVQVLGTSFNVKVRENDFMVACKTGKVNVIIASKDFKNILVPGESIALRDNTIVKKDMQLTLIDGWTYGEFYFDNQPIGHVLLELQRQFKTKVNTEKIDTSRLFSGYFTNENLEDALKMVCSPMDIEYQKNNNKYVLENKK